MVKVVREHNGKYYLLDTNEECYGYYAAEISYEAFKLLEHIDCHDDFRRVDWDDKE